MNEIDKNIKFLIDHRNRSAYPKRDFTWNSFDYKKKFPSASS